VLEAGAEQELVIKATSIHARLNARFIQQLSFFIPATHHKA
jgi:hypothetical protein